jgi:hypothetical protein
MFSLLTITRKRMRLDGVRSVRGGELDQKKSRMRESMQTVGVFTQVHIYYTQVLGKCKHACDQIDED